ncbi:hypothetical protein K3U93_05335 [Mycobacterium malmoense]|jgi:hypothetical protein|uniref:hypothetical protein n=1 Tax=Mycobacterium malmoense TaxID=1780 RepID=UPI00111C78F8|nr:hypothetical protein [Mycobacterium malmoense]QZA18614.1 hypothetical protein K3U93_05335 [Mycobacterium malmoense]UNB95386.1 hypothetical protein H5T25_05325 [Mycobacterium malmoense]
MAIHEINATAAPTASHEGMRRIRIDRRDLIIRSVPLALTIVPPFSITIRNVVFHPCDRPGDRSGITSVQLRAISTVNPEQVTKDGLA